MLSRNVLQTRSVPEFRSNLVNVEGISLRFENLDRPRNFAPFLMEFVPFGFVPILFSQTEKYYIKKIILES